MLDAFSGVGGASRGYQWAGMHVTGVDIAPQPDYCGDDFVEGDAVAFIARRGHMFDVIHASPPCQASCMTTKGTNRRGGRTYPQLIPSTRAALVDTGRPWVIENVVGAELRRDLVLCGLTFSLRVFRHRVFEIHGFTVPQPGHLSHAGHRVRGWRHGEYHDGDMLAVYGSGGGKATTSECREALGIGWTSNRDSLVEAIPPAYAEYIGRRFSESSAAACPRPAA